MDPSAHAINPYIALAVELAVLGGLAWAIKLLLGTSKEVHVLMTKLDHVCQRLETLSSENDKQWKLISNLRVKVAIVCTKLGIEPPEDE